MADDQPIHQRITDLVGRERDLRARLAAGQISIDEERHQLTSIESELDQAWDLLRQRQAHREFGQDPDTASTRSGPTVEGYLQ
jgi:hypothetical protein